MEEIDLAAQTLFAELVQRALDAEFDAEHSEKGSFIRKESKGRDYWHYQWREGKEIRNKYVLGFKSTNDAKDNKWRKLKLKLNVPEGQQLHASIKPKNARPLPGSRSSAARKNSSASAQRCSMRHALPATSSIAGETPLHSERGFARRPPRAAAARRLSLEPLLP